MRKFLAIAFVFALTANAWAGFSLGPLTSGSPQDGGSGHAPVVTSGTCTIALPVTNGVNVNLVGGGSCVYTATCNSAACSGTDAITGWAITAQSVANSFSITNGGILQGGSAAGSVTTGSYTVTVTATNSTDTSPGVVQSISTFQPPVVASLPCTIKSPIANNTNVVLQAGGNCQYTATCGGGACSGANAISGWSVVADTCASCYQVTSAGILQGSANAATVTNETDTVTVIATNAGGNSPNVGQTVKAVTVPSITNQNFSTTLPVTSGETIGTMVAFPAPSSWAITAVSGAGATTSDFAISSGGVITTARASPPGAITSSGTATISLTATNATGTSPTGTATISVQSSNPWAAIDGSTAASGGTAQFATILNAYHGGGVGNGRYQYPTVPTQNGSHQPEWNVAGVDYAVGPQAGTVFADGTNPTNLPSGVAISNGQITVTTSGTPITINALDFTALTGGGGASSNVFLINGTGTVNITNCKFKAPGYFSNGNQFFIRSNSAATVNFNYNDVDGNGALNGPLGWNEPLFQMNGSNKFTAEYNYVHNISYDGIYPSNSLNANITGPFLIKYNLFAYVNYAAVAHFDVIQSFGGGTGLTVQFNTLYQPTIDQNSVSLGPVNSFVRVGDLGSSSPLTFTGPEVGWNTVAGPGRILSIMQITDNNTPSGFFVNPSVHDNFLDVGNVQNFWIYPVDSHFSGISYTNNVALNTGGILPSFSGAGTGSWSPGFLNGGATGCCLPSPYVAPTGVYPHAELENPFINFAFRRPDSP